MNANCYDRALKAAVEKDRCGNAEKLILVGATNIDEVMKSAKQVDIRLMLLMVKAVLEDDHQLIMEIKRMTGKGFKGSKTPSEQSGETLPHSADADHTRNSNYDILCSEEMTKHIITGGRLRTRVPIKLAIKLKKPSIILDELLSITNIDFDAGSIGWSNLNLSELDIKWITNLPKHMMIKQLNLSQNQLSVLPISVTSHLRRCTKLDLHQNNIKYVPTSILELPMIKELNLSLNRISELPNVSWSASLVRLNLSRNELKTLPDCATELCSDSMAVLQLEHNQLKTVPKCVSFLYNLNTLDISHNPEILVLPVDLGRLKELKQLNLNGLHHLYDPPPSICENSATCISYLQSQFLRQNKYYRMKLMLVGKESVGKTTMVACLQDKQHPGGSTVGVDIGKWSYRPKFTLKPTFFFSVWDFAGQEEYYATHQVFLSKRSLYLAVWNVEEGRKGIAELKPWLNNIILRAPESRIIIIATHLDRLIAQHGKPQAYAKCDEYKSYLNQIIGREFIEKNVAKVMFVGLIGKRENVTELKKEIYTTAESYKIDKHLIMGSSIPASYEKVDSKLLKLPGTGILHATEFKGMVRSLGQPDLQHDNEIRALALFLHDIGSLLHFDDHRHNLDDLYFAKPQWLSKLMSNVIKKEKRTKYVKDGKILTSDFKQLFEQAGTGNFEEHLEQYLVLFNRFELALPLDKQGDLLLIPCFLPPERPAIVDELSKEYHYQRYFGFCGAITPPGLWSRLLSRLMTTVAKVRDLMDQNDNENGELHYWDKGLYCRSDDLLFVIESCPSHGDGISIIYSFKAAREGVLSQLVNLVQQIVNQWFPGLQFEQNVCCYKCSKQKPSPTFFKLQELMNYIAENKPFQCEVCNNILDLRALTPDLLLDDIDAKYILDINSVHYNETVVWNGRFGKIYRGDIHSVTPVMVKFYDKNEEDSQLKKYEEQFRNFRAEVTNLQKIKHPCLVAMIGVCKYPNIALVMEDSPVGSLDSCLLKELHYVSRIVVYRIAAQVASALRFLHSIPLIYRSLNSSKVLIWTLSLDDMVNCKLADLEVACYGNMRYVESSFANQFIAPEVREQAIYDQRIDIFSLGVVLLQMIQRNYPTEYRQSLPEWEVPETIKSFSIPDSELHHIGHLAKKCCSLKPADRPDLHEIVEQLCDPVFQLVMDVTTFDGTVSCACTGCVRHVETSVAASYSDYNTEAWISSLCVNGSEVIALSLKGKKIESEKRYCIKNHQINAMLSHGNHVWATSIQAGHKGSLLRFDGNKKDEYIEVPIKTKGTEGDSSLPDGDYGVSLACSDNHVYVGTISGWCLMFPIDINNDTVPIREVYLSCNFIRSMVVVEKTSLLWVSTGLSPEDQILFVNLHNLEFDQDRKGMNINDYRVGTLLLSPDEEIVWTVHINGHSISAWNTQKRKQICEFFDAHNLLGEKIDKQKSRIASASVVLDTLWVGLISGHIIVVTATLPQRASIVMKPYNRMVQILVPIYGKDNNNNIMISIGEDYRLEKQSRVKKHKSLDMVVWEVGNSKRMLQMNHLSTGNAWLNDSKLNEVCITIPYSKKLWR